MLKTTVKTLEEMIEDYENRIFNIEMCDRLTNEDYDLLNKYNTRLTELKAMRK